MAERVLETGPQKSFADTIERAGQKLNGIVHPLAGKVCIFSMVLVVAMVIAVVAEVILRMVDISVLGISEAVTYMMAILTFLALGFVGANKSHIQLDMFMEKFSPGIRGALTTAHNIMAMIIIYIFGWRLLIYALQNKGLTGSLLPIKLSWIMYVMLFGLFITMFVVIGDLLLGFALFLKNRSILGLSIIILLPLVIWTIPVWFGWVGINTTMAGVLAIVLMLALVLSGIPIAYALGIAGMVLIAYLSSWDGVFAFTGRSLFVCVSNYYRAVIPFFVTMGTLMATTGIGADLFKTMRTWAGRLPGSMCMAMVASGAAFGAVCGDSMSTAATIGKIGIPEMKKAGYPLQLASGSVAAGGTLGIMIPPSNTFIIYAIVTEQSIARLFMAGLLPGILITLCLCVVIYIVTKRDPRFHQVEAKSYSMKEKLASLTGVLPILGLFLLCIGGIYAGFFTPVQGGAVGAFGTFLFVLLRNIKGFKISQLKEALVAAANISGMVLFMLVGVEFLNSGLGFSQIPMDMANAITNSGLPGWVVFGAFILIFLAAGFILNIMVVLLLTVPIMLPTLVAMNVNLVWFGVIFVLVVMIGQLTPPIGVVCFLVRTLDKDLRLEDVYKGVTPMWLAMIGALLILIAFPQISLFLESILL